MRAAGKRPTAASGLAAVLAVLVLAAGVSAGTVWLGRDQSAAFFKTEAAEARYRVAYDAVLAKWPVAYQEITVPTRLGVTHVIASGPADAPPLVLLHAAMATATVWRPNVEALSEHFRVYAVDTVGQGGRTVASRRIESRRDYADWLNDLFDGLGIARASIVGNSYGGFIAFNQAAMAPERIERMVLISPAGGFVSVVPWFLSTDLPGAEGSSARRLRRRPGPGPSRSSPARPDSTRRTKTGWRWPVSSWMDRSAST